MRLMLLSVLLIACGNMPLPTETVDGSTDATDSLPTDTTTGCFLPVVNNKCCVCVADGKLSLCGQPAGCAVNFCPTPQPTDMGPFECPTN